MIVTSAIERHSFTNTLKSILEYDLNLTLGKDQVAGFIIIFFSSANQSTARLAFR